MPDAVIGATARSPIGRARTGSLASIRPGGLATRMLEAVSRDVGGGRGLTMVVERPS